MDISETDGANAVTAVVLNWRTPQLTLRARAGLVADGLPAARVLLVDNGSGDGSATALRVGAAGSPVLALPENVGFARASNAGAHALPSARAFLFVNPDAFVHLPGTVAALVAAVAESGVGIAVPRLRNPDLTLQSSVVPISAPLPEILRASGLSRWVPNERQPRLGAHWDHGRTRDIQSAVGPVIAVSASAWRAVGGFDERIFMYGEDHELFRRMRTHGYRARFVGEAEFVHLGGASSGQVWGDAQRAQRVAWAEGAMILRELSPSDGRVTVGAMTLGAGARAVVRAARGQRAASQAQLAWMRGYAWALRRSVRRR